MESATGLEAPARSLSGGNQQKVVLGKWLLARPAVFLLDEPTRGIDVGAKQQVYRLIADLADAGAAILVASSEIEELLGLCDRVLVMRRGQIAARFARPGLGRARARPRASTARRSCARRSARARRRPTREPRASALPALPILVAVGAVFTTLSPRFIDPANLVNIVVQCSSVGIVATGMTFVLLTAGIDLSVGADHVRLRRGGREDGRRRGLPPRRVRRDPRHRGGVRGGERLLRDEGRGQGVRGDARHALRGARLRAVVHARRAPSTCPRPCSRSAARGSPSCPCPRSSWPWCSSCPTSCSSTRRSAGTSTRWATTRSPRGGRGFRWGSILFSVYVLSGTLAALGGAVAIAQLGAVSPSFGREREFAAVAAAVLGGVSLFGGRGAVLPGVLLGAVLVQTVENGLVIVNADPYLYPLVMAGVIFLAVWLDSARRRVG